VENIHFTQTLFKQFIDLQTELHQSLCKRRTLATVGSHDYHSIQKGDLFYDALPPKEICFVPLKEEHPVNAMELQKFFENHHDFSMLKYLEMLSKQPLWPVLMDSSKNVLSLPPVINSQYSQISISTTAMLLECTSNVSIKICKEVMNTFLNRFSRIVMYNQENQSNFIPMVINQVEVWGGEDCRFLMKYPSQKDLEDIEAMI